MNYYKIKQKQLKRKEFIKTLKIVIWLIIILVVIMATNNRDFETRKQIKEYQPNLITH